MSVSLFSWWYLNIRSLCLFNSWLVNLYLMRLIFSSKQKLHLLLKLSGNEDFLINLHLICGVRPLSFKLQNHLNRAVSFLSKGLEKRVCMIVEPLFLISSWDSDINPLLLTIFLWGNSFLVDHFLWITHFSNGTIFFISTITK